ncbi:hypothetical protein GX51_00225 [Blastomyces parvus]|uniref:Uncharacterized protein n=1 Tax=Blastomyces parvus TaxID=2060905 RepID=A0A2B7XLY6_9EURO|nr:hypothetical protein GX51_00225 [Blastomyces parvus]
MPSSQGALDFIAATFPALSISNRTQSFGQRTVIKTNGGEDSARQSWPHMRRLSNSPSIGKRSLVENGRAKPHLRSARKSLGNSLPNSEAIWDSKFNEL